MESVDIDSIMTGVPASLREAYAKLVELIKKMEEAAKGPIKIDLVLDEAEKAGIQRAEAQRLIDLMIDNYELYEPRPGYVKRMSA